MTSTVRTTCPYCGVGCGVLATAAADGRITVRGDPEHPANFGRLCSKGAALGDTVDLEQRLLYPQLRGRPCSWEAALAFVADGLQKTMAVHGAESVAFYVSGQLLTEDYYVANKLMKGFIGTANIDTNSRLCMASSVAGHKRAFGSDTVPGCYEDLDEARLVVFAGSNAAWCHPILFQRVRAAKERDPTCKTVVVDPRRTATCDIADLHLPLRPGTDAVLWNGLLAYLTDVGAQDRAFLDAHTEGAEEALAAASPFTPARVAAECELPQEAVRTFYRWFAENDRVVSVYSQGINQSSSGADKVNAILNCHLLTGRIGKPGSGPLSFTGQPNAMGGREVGGLANTLAAHMGFDQADLVQRFWQSPTIASTPGRTAVDLFEGVFDGRIKAVWIVCTNPVVSLPNADRVREALARCDLVVVSDCIHPTDTTVLADVLLPACTWGEKEGTVTNSERRVSRQRRFMDPPGEARPDWWMICEVAKRMGYAESFDYEGVDAIFREHAALSACENDGRRDFDLGPLASVDRDAYNALSPVQWPVRSTQPQGMQPQGTARMFADGRFFTPSGRGRFVAVHPRPPVHATSDAYPLVLNTGRVRDHWHTLTRTGKSARLAAHTREPFVQIHPEDAAAAGLQDGDLAIVSSRWGQATLRVVLSAEQRRGSVFAPMHWTDQFASKGRIGPLVHPTVDPVSAQPESKHTPCRLERLEVAWHGLALGREPLAALQDRSELPFWSRSRERGCWRYEFAGLERPADWAAWAQSLGGDLSGDWLRYEDASAGRFRAALVAANRLEACIFVGPAPQGAVAGWLASLFERGGLSDAERLGLLMGRPAGRWESEGKLICSCFGVHANAIRDAVEAGGVSTVAEIGTMLGAGTNCGSCIPELRAFLE